MPDTLTGTIQRVTFHNPENGFVVLRVLSKPHGLVAVVGQIARAIAGEYIEAIGTWHEDPEHGSQFKADSIRTTPPSTLEGIEKYLGSGLIKGIGAHYARKIVEVFGTRTLEVIDESPTYLKEIKGIGALRIQRIRESWRQQKAVRDIMVFLQSHGVSIGRAVRIYKTYGDRALELVRANPYRLANDVWGFGFPTADALAERMGIDRLSPQRAEAALRYVLSQLSDDGHCGYPEGQVLAQASQLTGIDETLLSSAVETLLERQDIFRETAVTPSPWLYSSVLYRAECDVAGALQELRDGAAPLADIKRESAIDWVEKKMAISFAPSQRAALDQAFTHKVLVVTGGPGVGKTTIVRGILEIFEAKKLRCALAAPTGRAAKRLTEATGRQANTLHRLLEFDRGGPKRRADNPLDLDLLIVDETSMVDISLMNKLLRAMPPRAGLILVGDVDQLPSVGPGSVLRDIIDSKAIPVVRLVEIFRQAQQSGIVRAAHRVNEGLLPELDAVEGKLGDFYVIQVDEPATIIERVITLVRERIPKRFGLDPFEHVQVLTPMNKGELGVRALNKRLQAELNPSQGESEVERFGITFRPGDKVMQTRNNYEKEVFNGDIGRVRKIDEDEQELTVAYDGTSVVYDFDELDELALAYALTIHKSQGSEYPAVIVPLHTQHFVLLQRNLLYTALTRGRQLVVLVGSQKALSMAVGRQDTAKRCTALAARLRGDGR